VPGIRRRAFISVANNILGDIELAELRTQLDAFQSASSRQRATASGSAVAGGGR
jgi:hypothetical protein